MNSKIKGRIVDASNKNKIDSTAFKSFNTLYDVWFAAKSNQKVKKEKLAELQKLYKAVLYKQLVESYNQDRN